MQAIWKFPIQITDCQAIDMPAGSRVLSCCEQNGGLCLWALVDDTEKPVPRLIVVKGTGHPFSGDLVPEDLAFVATVVTEGRALVRHVFDAGFMS